MFVFKAEIDGLFCCYLIIGSSFLRKEDLDVPKSGSKIPCGRRVGRICALVLNSFFTSTFRRTILFYLLEHNQSLLEVLFMYGFVCV